MQITSDQTEIWAGDLYHSTALVEVAKSLAPSNVIGHGKVPCQKPSMEHGIYPHIVPKCAMPTQCEWSIGLMFGYSSIRSHTKADNNA